MDSNRYISETPSQGPADPGRYRSLALVRKVAARLQRRFGWLDADELASYAYLGLRKAARDYDPTRSADFGAFASVKGMYLAIDEMRRDGLVRRPDSQQTPAGPIEGELPDPDGEDALRDLVNRDTAEALLAALPQEDRDLLMMYYGQGMTLREIGQVRGVTEAAVCVRHQQLLAKLRRCARRFGLLAGTAGCDAGRHEDA